MKFNSICLITKDVQELANFYEKAFQANVEGDKDYMKVFIEGADLSIYAYEGMERMAPGSTKDIGSGSVVIEVEVRDADAEYQRLAKHHIKVLKELTTQDWGIRSFWFSDPDGNIINFYTNLSTPI